ncbi:hypothetical protein F9S53_02260 [Escherichia coli]|nr:hypothetical protein [Escherichia coli]
MFYLGTALFTQQTRASPGDGLITQSTRAQKWWLQPSVLRRCPFLLCMEKFHWRWQPPHRGLNHE